MAQTISALYQMGSAINDFLDRHIDQMKQSDNPTIERSGRVLEAAKLGFGLGYLSSVIIIAVGQLLLGNPLDAVVAVAQTATLANPIAMTCAALGALLYGYAALSQQERDELLLKLSYGLEVGIELIKAVIKFVTDKAKELLESEYITAIKSFIKEKAALFGRNLGQVTGEWGDKAKDLLEIAEQKTGEVLGKAKEMGSDAVERAEEVLSEAKDKTTELLGSKAKAEPPDEKQS